MRQWRQCRLFARLMLHSAAQTLLCRVYSQNSYPAQNIMNKPGGAWINVHVREDLNSPDLLAYEGPTKLSPNTEIRGMKISQTCNAAHTSVIGAGPPRATHLQSADYNAETLCHVLV